MSFIFHHGQKNLTIPLIKEVLNVVSVQSACTNALKKHENTYDNDETNKSRNENKQEHKAYIASPHHGQKDKHLTKIHHLHIIDDRDAKSDKSDTSETLSGWNETMTQKCFMGIKVKQITH